MTHTVEAPLATLVLVLAMLAAPAFWVGYISASTTSDPSIGMVLGLLLVTFSALILWKVLQVRRPYRFTKRTAMTVLDELVDQSLFGVGTLRGWTYTNPNVTLNDLRGGESPFIARPTAPIARAKPKPVLVAPSSYARHTVERGDTFWSLAERFLGQGGRWSELLAANLGTEVAPGVVLKEDDLLVPGWVVAIPEFEEESGS